MNRLNSFTLSPFHFTDIELSVQSMTCEEIWNIVKDDKEINQEIIQSFSLLLLSQDFNPFEINPTEGMSLLQEASFRGKTEIIRCILSSPRFPIEEIQELIDHKCHYHDSTALNYACLGGHLDIFKLLRHAGASIYVKDKHGNTTLHLAMKCSNPDIMSELVRINGRNPDFLNAQDNVDRLTALHCAAISDNVAMVQMLVAAGASLDIKDKYGNIPLQEAAEYGKAGAYWALIIAGSLFREDHISLIIKKGCVELFIRVGLGQLLEVFKLLETCPFIKKNQIVLVLFNRILNVFSKILNLHEKNIQNSYEIISCIQNILQKETIKHWLQSILVGCEIELTEMRSLTCMSQPILSEQIESLSASVKNFDAILAHFNQSLELCPALSPLSLSSVIFSFQLQRNSIYRWISDFRKANVDSSISSSSSVVTTIPQSTNDSSFPITLMTPTSDSGESPPRQQRPSGKRDRTFVSIKELRSKKLSSGDR